MCVMNHNWSARKQRLHLQSVAGISRHSALSEDRIRQCVTPSHHYRSCVCKSPFPSTATQCLCYVRKRFSRDHIAEEGQNPVARLWVAHRLASIHECDRPTNQLSPTPRTGNTTCKYHSGHNTGS